jgi:biopolymer transport protein ExbD
MVDCFFLITEFFVLTFKFKVDESVLPQKLPPCGGRGDGPALDSLRVHVNERGKYEVLGNTYTLQELTDKLASLPDLSRESLLVRVSYAPEIQWGQVLPVFDACSKVRIGKCGLVPLHGADVPGGVRPGRAN